MGALIPLVAGQRSHPAEPATPAHPRTQPEKHDKDFTVRHQDLGVMLLSHATALMRAAQVYHPRTMIERVHRQAIPRALPNID